MKTVERYSFTEPRRKLDITVALMVNDQGEHAEQRHETIKSAAYKAIGDHVERRVDALREDVMKHDVSIISRDFEQDLDLRSPKILRRIAVEIAERIGDLCSGDEGGAIATGFEDVKLDAVSIEAQPMVQGGAGTALEVEVSF